MQRNALKINNFYNKFKIITFIKIAKAYIAAY